MHRNGFQPKRKEPLGCWRIYWLSSEVLSFLSPSTSRRLAARRYCPSGTSLVVLQEARASRLRAHSIIRPAFIALDIFLRVRAVS